MRRKKFVLSGIWKDSRKKFHWNVMLKFVLEKYSPAYIFFFCCHQSQTIMIVHHHSEDIPKIISLSKLRHPLPIISHMPFHIFK